MSMSCFPITKSSCRLLRTHRGAAEERLRANRERGDLHAEMANGIGDGVVYPTSFPRTRERLEKAGISVTAVDVSELQKAEGAVTCCSLLVPL